MVREHAVTFRVAKQIFFSAYSGGVWICWPVASTGIEREVVAVLDGDSERLARCGPLIETVGLFRFVIVRNPRAESPSADCRAGAFTFKARTLWRLPAFTHFPE